MTTHDLIQPLHRLRPLLVAALLLPAWGYLGAQVTIWSEDFNSYPNGTTNAPPKWTSYATDCDDPALNNGNTWGVVNGQFEVTDVEGAPCCPTPPGGGGNDNGWESETIDISGYCDVSISVDVSGSGSFECGSPAAPVFGCDGVNDNSHDQIVIEYALDGGAWTLFPNGYVCGATGLGTITATGLNGTTLQIRIRIATKANAESYYFDNVLVQGLTAGPVNLPALGPYCKNSTPVALPNPVNGISGTWSGPGVSANTLIPANVPGLTATLTFTPDPGQCGTANTTTVVLIEPQPVALSPLGTYCQTDAPVPLPSVVNGVQGAWSGPGVVGNQFIPAGQSGTVTLTFTPLPSECALPNTTTATVNAPAAVALPALGPYCSNDPPVSLPTTIGGVTGNWSGSGVTNNQFDPSVVQDGTVTLTFTPNAGQCALPNGTAVTVTPAQTVALPTLGPFCESDSPVALDTMPSGITGTWSGPGVSGTTFDPAGLQDTVTLTFTPQAGQCADVAATEVVIDTTTQVQLMPLGPFCESDSPVALDTMPSGISGTWAGAGVTNDTFAPAGLADTVLLTFVPDAGQCADTATLAVRVDTLAMPAPAPLGSFCESDPPLPLDTMPSGIIGHWSGPGVSGDTLYPAGLAGTLTLHFTPDSGQCALPDSTTATVTPLGMPALATDTLCANNGPYALAGLADPLYPAGTWSGPGVVQDTLFPDTLSGNVTLTFAPTGNCAQPAATAVYVRPSPTPALGTATRCATDAPWPLDLIADPNLPGTWSGPGVSADTLYSDTLSGIVTLLYTPADTCAFAATTTVEVLAPAVPQLLPAPFDTLCANEAPYDLALVADPNLPGTWSGPGVSGNAFDPSAVNAPDSVALTYLPDSSCALPGYTSLIVAVPPAAANLSFACDSTNTTYTVSFDISGGFGPPWYVDGMPASGPGFQSGPLPSGSAFSFQLSDDGPCNAVTVEGAYSCSCTTYAGTMQMPLDTPIYACVGDVINVQHNGDAVLDANDTLVFVLHTSSSDQLGSSVLVVGSSPAIAWTPSIIPDSVYYISAVAGDFDGFASVDFSDPCLSVAPGVPVVFHAPSATLGPAADVCFNDCTALAIGLTGYAPFDVVIGVDTGSGTWNDTLGLNDASGQWTFCPDSLGALPGVYTVHLLEVTDSLCTATIPNQMQDVTVLPLAQNAYTPLVCAEDTVTVNGTAYHAGNPAGIEIFAGGAANGCDSVVQVQLQFYPAPIGTLDTTLCFGESLTFNGNTYDANNPTGTEILPNANWLGCDSTVQVQLSFYPEAIGTLDTTICFGESLTFNGNTYDANNPTGTEILPNANWLGCDSTVQVQLSFYPEAVGTLDTTLCPGESLTFNGNTYDANNPTGTEILPNANWLGCDSVVQVQLSFYPEAVGTLDTTLCPGESLVLNGTTYDANNLSGTEVLAGASWTGCDSIVQVSLQFHDPSGTLIDGPLCAGESIVVNGTLYDESNPQGVEVLPGASWTGCDSIILIDLVFVPAAQSVLDTTLCPGASLLVNGTLYDATNPSGTELIAGGSWLGCDSIVAVSLSFFAPATAVIDTTLCAGEALIVNGTTYDEQHPQGTEVIAGGSWAGCDSTITISLAFHPPALAQIAMTIPADSSIVVNGTVYDAANPSGTEVIGGGSWTGCDSTVIVSLSFLDFEIFTTTVSPTCAGQYDGMIVIDSVKGAKLPLTLEFMGALIPLDALPYTLPGLGAGTYELAFTDASGLTVTTTVALPDPPELFLDLGGTIEVFLGESVKLQPTVAGVPASWQWSPPDYLDCTDCPSPTAVMPLRNITYTAVVSDTAGCTATDSVLVLVKKRRAVYVPNVFSPDGDGFNDRFYIQAGPEVALLRDFRIFDRWGNLVFETRELLPNDYAGGWDGTWKGQPAQQGVYVYTFVVEYLDGTTQRYRGDVTLVR